MIHSVILEKTWEGFTKHVKTWKVAKGVKGCMSIAFNFEIIHPSGHYSGGCSDFKDFKHL